MRSNPNPTMPYFIFPNSKTFERPKSPSILDFSDFETELGIFGGLQRRLLNQ